MVGSVAKAYLPYDSVIFFNKFLPLAPCEKAVLMQCSIRVTPQRVFSVGYEMARGNKLIILFYVPGPPGCSTLIASCRSRPFCTSAGSSEFTRTRIPTIM